MFGEQHGQVVWSLDKIAHCLHALGQVDEALASFHQALDAQMLIAKVLITRWILCCCVLCVVCCAVCGLVWAARVPGSGMISNVFRARV